MHTRLVFNRRAFSEALSRNGLGIRGLARRIGIDHANVIHWREGRANPQLNHAFALAEALGVRVDELWSVVRQSENVAA